MGIKFKIQTDTSKSWRITYFEEGFFIFYFSHNTKDMQKIAEQYVKDNHANMKKWLLKKQAILNANNKLVEQYLNEYPNILIVFGTQFFAKELDIESLSQKLYIKSKEILDEYAFKMQLNYNKLVISYVKSYLGQCNGNIIKINYRNVLSDERLLRYLIVHELAHIRHPNHSKMFWQEVEKFYPKCKIADKELKIMSNRNECILRHYELDYIKKKYK